MTPSDIALIHAALSGNPDPEVTRAWERVKGYVADLRELIAERAAERVAMLRRIHAIERPDIRSVVLNAIAEVCGNVEE